MNTTVLSELRRRNVVKVAGAYLLIAWGFLQVAGALEDALELPAAFDGYVVALLALGFPVALGVAWVFDLTREGIQRTAPVEGASPALPRLAVALLFVLSLLGGGGIAAYWFLTTDRAEHPVVLGDKEQRHGREDAPGLPASEFDAIAVLPLSDLGPDGAQEHLGLAIADELRNVLSRVQGIRVASRPSSLAYRGEERPGARAIAAELNVTHILDGSVQQAGDTLRVNVQLIEGASDSQLMARTFDLPLSVDNILSLQDEIAGEVVASLGRDLGASAQDALRFLAASGTDSLAAYDAFLVAREKFFVRNRATNPEDFEAITRGLENATRIDPDFGHAWAALAMQYYTTIAWGGDPGEYALKARDAAERALALDQRLALAHAVLGVTSVLPDGRPDRAAAIDGLTRAIDLDPMEPTLRSWRGQHWIELGFFERGIRDLEETIQLTVFNGVANFWIINARFLLGDIEGAMARIPDWNRDDRRMRILHAVAIGDRGDHAAIRAALMTDLEGDPVLEEVAGALTVEGYDHGAGYARLKAVTAGDEELARLMERPLLLYVFRQYDRLPQEPPLSGRLTWWLSAHDDFLRAPERYRYFHDMGLSDYWLARDFPPRCAPDDSEAGFGCR